MVRVRVCGARARAWCACACMAGWAQVCPAFPYALTLAGHEHAACEDWSKAAACYKGALKLDPRHYNAQ